MRISSPASMIKSAASMTLILFKRASYSRVTSFASQRDLFESFLSMKSMEEV